MERVGRILEEAGAAQCVAGSTRAFLLHPGQPEGNKSPVRDASPPSTVSSRRRVLFAIRGGRRQQVGVWTIDAQIDAVERHLRGGGAGGRRGLPTPVDHYPRHVGWFVRRAWTLAWRGRAYSPLRLAFLIIRAWLIYAWSAVLGRRG